MMQFTAAALDFGYLASLEEVMLRFKSWAAFARMLSFSACGEVRVILGRWVVSYGGMVRRKHS